MPIEKIITGVDGREPSALAARRAAELASALGAELHITSAFGDFTRQELVLGGERIVLRSDLDAQKILDAVLRALRPDFPGLTIRSHPAEGKPAEALLAIADEVSADLIVIGNKGVQGPTRVLGSIARDVAARARCDLYVVHTHAR